MRAAMKGESGRPVVVLIGAVESRPDALERDLLRSGFQVAEADDFEQITGRPELVVVTCSNLADDCANLLTTLAAARPRGAQVVALVNGGTGEDLIRAAEAGADEAILLPDESQLLMPRLWARVISPRVAADGPNGNDLRLSTILQRVASEMYRDDMLHTLVRGLAEALDLNSVACLLHQRGAEQGRVAANSEAPKLRDESTRLDWWPQAVMALEQGITIYQRAGMLVPGGPGGEGEIEGQPLESVAAVVIAPLGRPIGTVVLRTRRGERPLQPGQVSFTERAVAAVATILETDERRSAMTRRQSIAAEVDPLTKCATLDALDRRLRDEFERARRYDATFALVLLDVDGMRLINDRLGRDGGHRLLADIGGLIQLELRSPDFVARYGGEEFLLLLPETDVTGARDTVHRIRERLRLADLVEVHPEVNCHLTAGVVSYPHPEVHRPEDLLARVEAALEHGKSQQGERIGTAA